MDIIGWIAFAIAAALVLFMAALAIKVVLKKDKLDSKRIDRLSAMKQKYDILKQEEGKKLWVDKNGDIEKR